MPGSVGREFCFATAVCVNSEASGTKKFPRRTSDWPTPPVLGRIASGSGFCFLFGSGKKIKYSTKQSNYVTAMPRSNFGTIPRFYMNHFLKFLYHLFEYRLEFAFWWCRDVYRLALWVYQGSKNINVNMVNTKTTEDVHKFIKVIIY